MIAWLTAFLFTQLVEVPIYMGGLRVRFWGAFAASTMTHPIVWFGVLFLGQYVDYWPLVVAAELFAWLVEAAWFKYALGRPRALLWAFIANLSSVCVGFISRALFNVP